MLDRLSPTVDALRELPLHELLAAAKHPICRDYALVLHLRADAEPDKSSSAWQALTLLVFVLGLQFDPDVDHQPFRTHTWFAELGPDNLSESHYQVLESWLPDVVDPEVAARVADLLWTTRRGQLAAHLHGRLAVEKYLDSARRLVGQMHWWSACVRVRRAFILAKKFRLGETVETFAVETLRSRGNSEPRELDSELMEILFDFDAGDPHEWSSVARDLAERAESALRSGSWGRPGPGLAQQLWRIAANWSTRVASGDVVQELKLRAAEMLIVEADHARVAQQPMAEAHFLTEAVRAFRALGVTDKVQELAGRIQDAQRRIPTVTYEGEIDVSEHAARARKAIAGKTLNDAVIQLAFLVKVPRKELLRDMAREHLNSSVVAKVASTVVMSHDARIVAVQPAMTGNEPHEGNDAELIAWQMRASAEWLRIEMYAYIVGALQQLVLEHHVRFRDLQPLVSRSMLVPEGHEGLFARGLLAGFQGDFVAACHILVPQFENALRIYVERGLGQVLLRQNNDGTQMAGLMGRILSVPELQEALGEDLVFDLQGLLIAQDSVNLRNNLAHGLIGDREFGPNAVYFWWLCLRVTCMLLPEVSKETRE